MSILDKDKDKQNLPTMDVQLKAIKFIQEQAH